MMPMKMRTVARVVMVCAVVLSSPVWAQRPAHIPSPATPDDAVLTLQASASRQVKEDTVDIVLSVDRDGTDQATVSRAINTALSAVMDKVKNDKSVNASTDSYRVEPRFNDQGHITGWQGQGQVRLTSRDFDHAAALAASLSGQAAIASINFRVSSQARAHIESELLTEAAAAFRARAKAAATAFGYDQYRIIELNLGGGGQAPMPRMMLMAAKVSASPSVPLESGTTTISLEVNGKVALLPQ